MAEMMFALGQTKKKKTEETKVRTTKSELKNVNITDTVEKDIRKEQHEREQKWKKTGRDQIKSNTNFDMARSLFGGGGPAPQQQQESDDEQEYVEEEVVEDDDRGHQGGEGEEEYVEEEVVEEEDEEEED